MMRHVGFLKVFALAGLFSCATLVGCFAPESGGTPPSGDRWNTADFGFGLAMDVPDDLQHGAEFYGIDSWSETYYGNGIYVTLEGGMVSPGECFRDPEHCRQQSPDYREDILSLDENHRVLMISYPPPPDEWGEIIELHSPYDSLMASNRADRTPSVVVRISADPNNTNRALRMAASLQKPSVSNPPYKFPTPPGQVQPMNNAVGVPRTFTATWSAGRAAQTHHLQVAHDTAFTNLVFDDSGLTQTSAIVTLPAHGTIFYWRVRTANPLRTSLWTRANAFTTHADASSGWTLRQSGTKVTLRSAASSESTWVAVGDSGTILTSRDAATWTKSVSGISSILRSIAWGDGRFVAVGQSGRILNSFDGVAWTSPAQAFGSRNFLNVVWNGSEWMAITGNEAFTSTDAVTWNATRIINIGLVQALTWTGEQHVTAGNSGRIFTSQDRGATWVTRGHLTLEHFRGLAANDKVVLAVSSEGIRASSDHGATWPTFRWMRQADPQSAVWVGTHFITVGNNGSIMTSADANVWTPVYSGTTNTLLGVGGSRNRAVAVGAGGVILSTSLSQLD
jgi:hypothetical protein